MRFARITGPGTPVMRMGTTTKESRFPAPIAIAMEGGCARRHSGQVDLEGGPGGSDVVAAGHGEALGFGQGR